MDELLPQDGAPSLPQSDLSSPDPGGAAPSITELEKLERVRFQGQEWTPKDLERALMRQKDYTQKTQSLSEERKSFEGERKFYENLHADLRIITGSDQAHRDQLISEFVKLYPQKFHGALRQALSQSSPVQQTQQHTDVELLGRVAHLEKFYHSQEVAKERTRIDQTVSNLSKQFPDAIPEMAIGRVFEAYNKLLETDPNAKLTEDMWKESFKTVEQQLKSWSDNRQKALIKKQQAANAKGAAPVSGGGTVGRAPPKFKSLKDVTDFAVKDLSGRS